MEPGSGSTIMSYAGITAPATNVQSNVDPYFHAISIDQITAHVFTRTCDVESPTGNSTPVVNAGDDIILPIGTPFRLTGSATDNDGADVLTYCWEQYNENDAATTFPDETSINNNSVLFRSYSPTTSSIRTFPKLEDLLSNGVNVSTWERIPTVGRTANFRLTVRDNKTGGGSNSNDDMIVTWDASKGPLAVTSQAATGIKWLKNETRTITWDVNNTNTMAGASTVDILLSIDGGLTYPITLASNSPNDGSQDITVPDNPAPYCRVMVQPTGAPFFAINSQDFAINYDINTVCNIYSSGAINQPIADDGDSFTEVLAIPNVPSSTITDINIGINITHTYIGDLAILAQSPSGTGILLVAPNDCGSQDDLNVKFDDDGLPFDCDNTTGVDIVYQSLQDPLSTWNGEDAAGQWLLGVGDYAAQDTGTINGWYVEVCETTVTLSDPDQDYLNNFTIYPNPNKGTFTVELNSGTNEDINIDVFDIRGRQIYSNLFESSTRFSQTVNLNVQTGVYLVKVSNGNFTETKKIIIE